MMNQRYSSLKEPTHTQCRHPPSLTANGVLYACLIVGIKESNTVYVKARLHYETQLNCRVESSWSQSYIVAGSKTAFLVISKAKT